MNEVTKKVSIS